MHCSVKLEESCIMFLGRHVRFGATVPRAGAALRTAEVECRTPRILRLNSLPRTSGVVT
jgi:hypothetical protein